MNDDDDDDDKGCVEWDTRRMYFLQCLLHLTPKRPARRGERPSLLLPGGRAG